MQMSHASARAPPIFSTRSLKLLFSIDLELQFVSSESHMHTSIQGSRTSVQLSILRPRTSKKPGRMVRGLAVCCKEGKVSLGGFDGPIGL